MNREILGIIKVPASVTPLPSKKRRIPELFVDHQYYISFAGQSAYPCILKDVIKEFDQIEVKVQLSMKVTKKGFLDSEGVRRYNRVQYNVVYANEIGCTPINAIENQVR